MKRTSNLAPIVVFAYNRPNALRNTLDALRANLQAKECDIYIYVDGPRSEQDVTKIEEVKRIADSIAGFKCVTRRYSEKNKGLANSIIGGVSDVINQYGKVIVLEDDLVVTPNFLSFMNQGLCKYEHERQVFSICGYTNKVKIPANYDYDAYLCARSSSWGWATWHDRWNSVDWQLGNWSELQKRKKGFNKWGGSDCWKMLDDWYKGKNSSWAIRFCFSQFMQNKLSLFPVVSKVRNDGFDGLGTNCKKWSRFKFVLDKSGKMDFSFPSEVKTEKSIVKSALLYHSIPIRVYSKIMYLIRR